MNQDMLINCMASILYLMCQKRQGNFADCLLCIDFLDIDEETERPSELYQFDLMELKWVKKKRSKDHGKIS